MNRYIRRLMRSEAVAKVLLPRLAVGEEVPSASSMARALKVSRPTAWAIVMQVLAEHGVEVYRTDAYGRFVVRRMPETQKGPRVSPEALGEEHDRAD